MNCHLYMRSGIVYVPTMGKMGKGFYRGVEPVAVVPIKNTDGLRQALKATIARGNPAVPQPQRRDDWPPPVVLKYAGVKSWSAFERGLAFWTLNDKQDGAFQISNQKKQSDGMWRNDPEQQIDLPVGSTVDDAIDCMIAVLQEAARK